MSEETKDNSRRLMRTYVNHRAIADWMNQFYGSSGIMVPIFDNFPEDATVRHVYADNTSSMLGVIVQSEEFDIVPAGEQIPEMTMKEYRMVKLLTVEDPGENKLLPDEYAMKLIKGAETSS